VSKPPRVNPPRAASWLLRRALPPGPIGDSIRGDLLEELSSAVSPSAGRRRYTVHALSIAIRYGFGRHAAVPQNDRPRRRGMMDTIRQDLMYAARSLAKRPSFSVMVIVTLALGIGAATAIFSIVNAILLRPLPYAHADRLVVFNDATGRGRMSLAWPNYLDFRDRSTSFEAVAAYQRTNFTWLDGGRARRLDGRFVSSTFLDVLGVRPQLGRTFTADDDRFGAEPVAIISDAFWTEALGADPGVVGRPLRTNEYTFTIVGVLPAGFRFGAADDLLAPIAPTAGPGSILSQRTNHANLYGIARLKSEVPLERARAELQQIAAALGKTYPYTNTGASAEVQLLRDRFVERLEPTLIALMGAVGFLLLLACANVANLLLARGAARQHELAIRTALGGSRWRLVQGMLVESSLLSLAGAVLGVVLAFGLVRVLVAMAPADTPRLDQVHLDRASLLFALAASIVCGLFFGAFPALHASSPRGEHLLARASRTSAAVSPRRTRRILMAAEVALALVLLSGCGLMFRTMLKLAAIDPGFRADHLLTARLTLAGPAWESVDKRLAFYEQVHAAVARIPGVTDAALTLSLPIVGSEWGSVFIVSGKPVPSRSDVPSSAFIPISERYFETMGIRLVRGRSFDRGDANTSAKVAIVNERLANRMWPGEDPIGKRLKQGWPEDDNPWREVVGLVADVKLEGVDRGTPLQVFLPMTQQPPPTFAIVARTSVEPGTIGSALETAVQGLQPDLPVTRIQPMTALMSTAVATRRLSTMIFGVFAAVAILIAAVGLYGVVSQSVTERTHEIGVRVALGAERRRILRLFIGQGLTIAVVGTFAGIAGAIGLSRWLRELVFGVEATDPLTLSAVGILLLFVAMLACYVPARRATKVDPLAALRVD
jgi:putative ABC transport system permease protein